MTSRDQQAFLGARFGLTLCFGLILASTVLAQAGGSVPAIVYFEPGKKANVWSLKVMKADGSGKAVVLPNAASSALDASWSADGSEIVFTSTLFGALGLCAVRPDGSGLRFIAPVTWDSAKPVWSPVPLSDGRFKILFEDRLPGAVNTDLYLVNTDGTGRVNLTNTVDVSEGQPTWAPDAARCAARVGHGNPWRTDVVVYALELVLGVPTVTSTSNVTDIPGSPLRSAATLASPDWARASDRITLSALLDGHFDLWVINLEAVEAPLRVTATPNVSEAFPSWSPDDARIVFRRDAGQTTSGLYSIHVGGSGLTTLDAKNGRAPDWRRP